MSTNVEILSSWVYLSLAAIILILLSIIHNHKCKVVKMKMS